MSNKEGKFSGCLQEFMTIIHFEYRKYNFSFLSHSVKLTKRNMIKKRHKLLKEKMIFLKKSFFFLLLYSISLAGKKVTVGWFFVRWSWLDFFILFFSWFQYFSFIFKVKEVWKASLQDMAELFRISVGESIGENPQSMVISGWTRMC